MKELINNLKKFWKYSKYQKATILLYFLVNLIGIVVSIVTPILSAKMIVALTANKYYQIMSIGLVIFFVECFRNVLYYVTRYSANKIYMDSFIRIQQDLSEEILKLDNKCIDNNSSGTFIQRLTNDTGKLSDIYNGLGMQISSIIETIGLITAIAIISKICALYLIVMTFIIFLVDKKRVELYKENDKIRRKKHDEVSGFIGEMIRGIRDIKMLNSETSFNTTLHTKVKEMEQIRAKRQKTDRIYSFFRGCLRDITDLILIIILIILLKNKSIAITTAIVIYNYAGRVPNIIYYLSNFMDSIADFNLSAERVYAILDSKEFTKEKFGKKHLDKVKGNFEFNKVTFAYNEKDSNVLKNLSFKIKSHQTVAFVGKSGAGKTTIFNLLCKMYPDYKGKITIDGIDIKELDKDSIRGNITIISQNPYIFNLSINDNLKLVKNDVTKEEIKKACELACLDTFIESLPDKYDTIIGEGGVNLSGGQKQRLAIARALIQKTEIILFDEATSALDNETQEHIQKAIENMKNDYTILIIAHRLSTIINADRILFLNNGHIEASGSHKELLKTSKAYKELYEAEIEKEN